MNGLEEAWIFQAWADLERPPAATPWATVSPPMAEGLQGMPEGPMPLDATQEPVPRSPRRRPGPEESTPGRATDREIAARARDHTWT